MVAAASNSDPVHKITILSRGRALGYTASCRTRTSSITRKEMLDQLAHAAGGRTAEELGLPRPHHRRRQRHREGDLDPLAAW